MALPVPHPDRYTILVYPVGGPDSDRATFRVAGGSGRAALLVAEDSNTLLPPIPLGAVSVRDSVRLEARVRHLPAAIEALPLRVWASEWHVVGPFPSPRVLGKETSPALDSVLAPERNPDLAASYAGVSGQPIRWRRVTVGLDGRVRLTRIFKLADWVLAYGTAFLYSPTAGPATLLLGADDGHVLWVNGERVSGRQGRHTAEPDDVAVPVRLRAGWNRVLVKVANQTAGGRSSCGPPIPMACCAGARAPEGGGTMNENKTTPSPWGGWLLHAVIGTGVTAVLAWLAAPPVAVLAMGIAHEIGDGDFLQANGGPWNGVLDVVAFLPAAIVFLAIHL
ncbi:MAG TPA: hypothetical protein VEK85_07260 [Gemmatimonadales bacterium]|nr:hypothetical protein [Gemmatimonadales bacterium]